MHECRDGIDYRKFYDANIESYLLTEVRGRFEKSGKITPLDFYLILHWKAPRVKNVHKERLKRRANGNFACAVDQIAEALHGTCDPKGRLAILMENKKWGFRLPTATAILTILFPQEFTVYDRRVCKSLGDSGNLQDRRFSEDLWRAYLSFKQKVVEMKIAPARLSLRDKDRYLWGKSFYEQAEKDCL
jgi:hypothetical protein